MILADEWRRPNADYKTGYFLILILVLPGSILHNYIHQALLYGVKSFDIAAAIRDARNVQ